MYFIQGGQRRADKFYNLIIIERKKIISYFHVKMHDTSLEFKYNFFIIHIPIFY